MLSAHSMPGIGPGTWPGHRGAHKRAQGCTQEGSSLPQGVYDLERSSDPHCTGHSFLFHLNSCLGIQQWVFSLFIKTEVPPKLNSKKSRISRFKNSPKKGNVSLYPTNIFIALNIHLMKLSEYLISLFPGHFSTFSALLHVGNETRACYKGEYATCLRDTFPVS